MNLSTDRGSQPVVPYLPAPDAPGRGTRAAQLAGLDEALAGLHRAYRRLPGAEMNGRPRLRPKGTSGEEFELSTLMAPARAERAARLAGVIAGRMVHQHERGPLAVSELCAWHAELTSDFPRREGLGALRAHPIRATDPRLAGQVLYAPAESIDTLLRQWSRWVFRTQGHPVVIAGLATYSLLTIHPFSDGNGRLSRMLLHGELLRRGAVPGRCLDLDTWTMQRQATYLRALEAADIQRDPSPAVDMYTTMVRECAVDSTRRAEAAAVALHQALARYPECTQLIVQLSVTPVANRDWVQRTVGEDAWRGAGALNASGWLRIDDNGLLTVPEFVEIWDDPQVRDAWGVPLVDPADPDLHIR